MVSSREYASLRSLDFGGLDRPGAMGLFVRSVWGAHSGADVSWVGFYVAPGQTIPEGLAAGKDEMLLAVREPKPACSPIGLHGACGRSWREKRVLVVNDIAALGDGYVACDPRDLAELVIPCFNADGSCWAVLDLDSYSRGAFSEGDAVELHAALVRAGLSCGDLPAVEVIGSNRSRER